MPPKPTPGLYEQLITDALNTLLTTHPDHSISRADLKEDAHVLLSSHVQRQVSRALESLSGKPDSLALVNCLLDTLDAAIPGTGDDPVINPPEALHAIGTPHPQLADQSIIPPRPSIPLSTSDLLVNARNEPRVGHALK